jgi:hypothetical protein
MFLITRLMGVHGSEKLFADYLSKGVRTTLSHCDAWCLQDES